MSEQQSFYSNDDAVFVPGQFYDAEESEFPVVDPAFEEWMRNEAMEAGIQPNAVGNGHAETALEASEREAAETGSAEASDRYTSMVQHSNPSKRQFRFNESSVQQVQDSSSSRHPPQLGSPFVPKPPEPRNPHESLESPPIIPRNAPPRNQNPRNYIATQPSNNGQPPQPAFRPARFTGIFDAQTNHLMLPGWRPSAGIYGMPTSEAGLMPYVAQLFNAFINTSEVYDAHQKPETAERFQHGGIWARNPDDIEAICHLIVYQASTLHISGATGLMYKRFPDKVPQSNTEDARLTFAQRIWLMTQLVRHYKTHADALMRQYQIEDHLVWMWKVLMGSTDFRMRFNARLPNVRASMVTEFQNLGMPPLVTGPPTAVTSASGQSPQGIKRPSDTCAGVPNESVRKRQNTGQVHSSAQVGGHAPLHTSNSPAFPLGQSSGQPANLYASAGNGHFRANSRAFNGQPAATQSPDPFVFLHDIMRNRSQSRGYPDSQMRAANSTLVPER